MGKPTVFMSFHKQKKLNRNLHIFGLFLRGGGGGSVARQKFQNFRKVQKILNTFHTFSIFMPQGLADILRAKNSPQKLPTFLTRVIYERILKGH